MTEEQYQGIKDIISDQIKLVVNGKIDRLTDMLNDHIKSDAEWKSDAEPIVTAGRNLSGYGRITVAIIAFIATLAAAITGIMKVFGK